MNDFLQMKLSPKDEAKKSSFEMRSSHVVPNEILKYKHAH